MITLAGKLRPVQKLALLALGLVLAAAGGFGLAGAADGIAADEAQVVVYKTPYCGCCKLWIEQVEDAGLTVQAIDVDSTAGVQSEVGVPRMLRSCHTAKVGDYWVEGHVPPDLVAMLLEEQPDDVRGLSVPGMPMGSPGMEGPNPVTYKVIAMDAEGNMRIYAERQGRATPP